MKKAPFLKAVSLILALSLMILIFCLSGQKASTSTKTSHSVTGTILSFLYEGFDELSKAQQTKLISLVDKTVRTVAHFLEYMLLSFLFSLNLSFYGHLKIKKAILALSGCLVFSLFDEIHQIFVPGRSFQFIDLFYDFLGALTGLILFYLARLIYKKIKAVIWQLFYMSPIYISRLCPKPFPKAPPIL